MGAGALLSCVHSPFPESEAVAGRAAIVSAVASAPERRKAGVFLIVESPFGRLSSDIELVTSSEAEQDQLCQWS